MTLQSNTGGISETTDTRLATATATVVLVNASYPVLVHSIAYACEGTGDTITLYVNDGVTSFRKRQVAVSANADGVFDVPFVLAATHNLYAQLTTGNATTVSVSHTIILK